MGARPPVLPRVGFAVLTVVLLLALLALLLLLVAVPEERSTFALPTAAMALGLLWVRGARRTWLDRHRPAGGSTGTTTSPTTTSPEA